MRVTIKGVASAALAAVFLATSAADAQSQRGGEDAARTVRFRGRTVDLRPFFEGFPYLGFRAELRAERLLYFHDTPEGRRLLQLPLQAGEAQLDLTRGERLGDIDWNRRSLRTLVYLPSRAEYLALADDANEERYNLFAMAADTGALRRITSHDYVYGVGLDRQRSKIAYIPRHGQRAPYRSCLHVIDVASMQDREVVCDTPELTFTWCAPSFNDAGTAVVINANRANARTHQNLVLVDLTAPAPALRVLTDIERRRRNVSVLDEWASERSFVYTSDEDGFTNVYRYDLEPAPGQPSSVQFTRFTEDVDSLVRLEHLRYERAGAAQQDAGAPQQVATTVFSVGAVVKRPYESELFIIEPTSGAIRARRVFDETLSPLDYRGDTAYFSAQSRRRMFALQQVSLRQSGTGSEAAIVPTTRATVPEQVARAVETCEVERVQIPTFDNDPRTGRARTLHAYVHRPRDRWPGRAQQFALIQSFYGGENRWDTQAQILCAAGATVVSPSVRGSAGFGADFAALNDRDLGGNEMFDLVHVARWISEREGLRPRQVGVYGGSHGGYAAMRALSMPEEVNGRRDAFEWGFGLSWFGFSNIVSFYERCNIPDWVLLEAGDPRTERARLMDRSPISHVDRVRAPLLLLHGENDNRVPVTESRQMADALRRARKTFVYEEFAGQGHGLKGLANQHRVWTAVFRFLEREARLAPRPQVHSAVRTSAKRALLRGSALLALVALCAAGAWVARTRSASSDR
jgi:dipeptidyl aminopeptidase/acylaminoacyl peptidase